MIVHIFVYLLRYIDKVYFQETIELTCLYVCLQKKYNHLTYRLYSSVFFDNELTLILTKSFQTSL